MQLISIEKIKDATKAPLTMLSFGGGQDSTALLLKLIHDAAFRAEYAPGDLVVIMSDTGDEHPHTLEHVGRMKVLCRENAIDFLHLTADQGYHAPGWTSLIAWQRRTGNVVMRGSKTCTHNLKITPIYKALDEYIGHRYSIPFGKKKALNAFVAERGPVRVIIGIAAGEERRVVKPEARAKQILRDRWMAGVSFVYPLIDLGMDRAACQTYIASTGSAVPMPSNCMRCPYMDGAELVWLERNYPAALAEWIELEATKISNWDKKNADLAAAGIEQKKNAGVFLSKTIVEALAEARAKFGAWSNEQLNNHKMNHGCTSAAF